MARLRKRHSFELIFILKHSGIAIDLCMKKSIQIVITVLCIFSLLISVAAKAQQIELFDETGVPTLEATQHEKVDLSFFKKLRQEIQSEQMKEHHDAEKDGWYKNTNKRFIPESTTFAIAGGGVYFMTLMIKTNSDPALMVKHIESLKDPIAHVAFYSFMVANGMYVNFKTKDMDPFTKQLAMKSLQYKGMAMGSLASSLTADLLGTFKACTQGWLENKNDESSNAACDEAYKTWTLRNKFTQYAPQIMSLWVSQAGADFVDEAGRKIKNFKWVQGAAQKAESQAIKLFKITASNIDLLITPGGPVVKSIAWLGKLTKFSMFLAVDHLLTPSVMKIGNNLLQPFFFQFDVNKLDRLIVNASKTGWSSAEANKDSVECPVQVKNCRSFNDLPKEIENYTYRMQQWRLHLNSKVENDLSGWLEITNKLLHQIDFSRNYYLAYSKNLFETLQRQNQVNRGEFSDEPQRAWATQTQYPFRALPLFGVSTGRQYQGEKESDLYLTKPWLIQKHQSENLAKIAQNFTNEIGKYNLDSISLKKAMTLLQKISASDIKTQGQGLTELNKILGVYSNELTPERVYLTPQHTQFLQDLRKSIGQPYPILEDGAGFNWAFSVHQANKALGKTADFSLSRRHYKFSTPAELMLYQMICGEEKAQIDESMLTSLSFTPPQITKAQASKPAYCNKWGTYLTSSTLNQFSNRIHQDIIKNIRPEILENIQDEFASADGFNKWWNEQTVPVVQGELQKLDQRYQTLVKQSYNNILDQKDFIDFSIDYYTHWSKRLSTNIYDNLLFELDFYVTTLENIFSKNKNIPNNYVDSIVEKSQKTKYSSTTVLIPKNIPQDKLITYRLIELKNAYLELIQLLQGSSEKVNFKLIQDKSEKLMNTSEQIFGQLKKLETMTDLPAEVKAVLSLRKGLEMLEMDTKRYLFMKVNLANRLEIDMAEMDQFLKNQSKNKVHNGTKPHGG